MQKLDRLGWAAGISVAAYGLSIGIRVKDPEILRCLPERLPFGWKATSAESVDRLYSIYTPSNVLQAGVRYFNLLYGDLLRLARTTDPEELLEAFEKDLLHYVAENAQRRVFVHAGAVGWRGRAIVLPGQSYSGKTTLVTELVRAGAVYLSDEYAVFDFQGRVHPFAQPVSLREPGGFRQQKFTIESLGGTAGSRALPVGLVVLCKYGERKRWRPKQVSPGHGTLGLLANTVSARRAPQAALQVFGKVVSGTPVLKSFRGDAREAAARILEYLDHCES